MSLRKTVRFAMGLAVPLDIGLTVLSAGAQALVMAGLLICTASVKADTLLYLQDFESFSTGLITGQQGYAPDWLALTNSGTGVIESATNSNQFYTGYSSADGSTVYSTGTVPYGSSALDATSNFSISFDFQKSSATSLANQIYLVGIPWQGSSVLPDPGNGTGFFGFAFYGATGVDIYTNFYFDSDFTNSAVNDAFAALTDGWNTFTLSLFKDETGYTNYSVAFNGQVVSGFENRNTGVLRSDLADATFGMNGVFTNANGSGLSVSFDNVTVSMVPEPTQMAFVAGAGVVLGGLRLRRRMAGRRR